MGNFTRTGRAHASWERALCLARCYAEQLERRFRVRGVRGPSGWAWVAERVRHDG